MNVSESKEPLAYSVFRYSNIFHVLFGASSNILAAFICLKSTKLRENPTYICTAFMNFACIIFLTAVPLTSFVSQVIGIDLENQNIYYCRAEAFLDSYSLQLNAWILVFYTLELYLNARITNFRKKYLSGKKTAFICVIIAIVLIPFNSPTWLIQQSLYRYVCIVTVENSGNVLSYIFMVCYSISSSVQLVVTIALNILLFREVFNRKKRIFISQVEQVMRNKIRSDIQSIFSHILLSTIAIILLILPRTILTMFAVNEPTDTNLFNYMCIKFALRTYFSFNLISLFSNKPFFVEFKTIIFRTNTRIQSNVTNTNNI